MAFLFGGFKRGTDSLRELAADTSGNFAVITALTVTPIIALMAGSVDLARASNNASELSQAVDSAALALANFSAEFEDQESLNLITKQYVMANLSGEAQFADSVEVLVDVTAEDTEREVTVTASGTMETYFLGLVNIPTIPIANQASAFSSRTGVEIALVVDVSSSMAGDRIAQLKISASSFVDQVLNGENGNAASLSLIPFGGTVNIGPDLFNRFAVPLDQANVDPSPLDYNIRRSVVEGDFRFTDGGNCIELPFEDFDGDLIPEESRGQPPLFWRWWNFNPWCPADASAAIFNSQNFEALTDRINELVLSDGTGMDYGVLWGVKSLSPAWRGVIGGDAPDRPADFGTEQNLKVMIVMSDGSVTGQDRPIDYTIFNTHTDRPVNEEPNGIGFSDQGNNHNRQTASFRGGIGNKSTQDIAVGRFKRACEYAHDNDIVVYSIGFEIRPNSFEERTLQFCAQDLSRYFLVEGIELQTAFDSIASSINGLRITG